MDISATWHLDLVGVGALIGGGGWWRLSRGARRPAAEVTALALWACWGVGVVPATTAAGVSLWLLAPLGPGAPSGAPAVRTERMTAAVRVCGSLLLLAGTADLDLRLRVALLAALGAALLTVTIAPTDLLDDRPAPSSAGQRLVAGAPLHLALSAGWAAWSAVPDTEASVLVATAVSVVWLGWAIAPGTLAGHAGSEVVLVGVLGAATVGLAGRPGGLGVLVAATGIWVLARLQPDHVDRPRPGWLWVPPLTSATLLGLVARTVGLGTSVRASLAGAALAVAAAAALWSTGRALAGPQRN